MDHVPLDVPPTTPTRATLSLLVGRVTTIKLAYWTALTVVEVLLPFVDTSPFAERLPRSIALAGIASLAAVLWANRAARAPDRRAGFIVRSIPAIATTFAATTVVASPASLPLLLLERERSLEQCGVGTCHPEALLLWIAILAVGTLAIPAVFAASLPRDTNARSLGR